MTEEQTAKAISAECARITAHEEGATRLAFAVARYLAGKPLESISADKSVHVVIQMVARSVGKR